MSCSTPGSPADTFIDVHAVVLELCDTALPLNVRILELHLLADGALHQRQPVAARCADGPSSLAHLVARTGDLVRARHPLLVERLEDVDLALRLVVLARAPSRSSPAAACAASAGSTRRLTRFASACASARSASSAWSWTSGLDISSSTVVGVDRRADRRDLLLDAPGGERGDDADVLRHQRARGAHLAHHRALLDGVDPQGRPLHARRGGLEAGQGDAHADDGRPGRRQWRCSDRASASERVRCPR